MWIRVRLALLCALVFAAFGAFLVSSGSYLQAVGLGSRIGTFYALSGALGALLPLLTSPAADRWIPAPKLLALCQLGFALLISAFVRLCEADADPLSRWGILCLLYVAAVGLFSASLPLVSATCFIILRSGGHDTVVEFPKLRVFGTIAFIASMWAVDLLRLQQSSGQFKLSAAISVCLCLYCLTLPECPRGGAGAGPGGLIRALKMLMDRQVLVFMLFSALVSACLQISNAYGTPFLNSFRTDGSYDGTFALEHTNILYSLSQISETGCMLLLPLAFRRLGIRMVFTLAAVAWALRFAFFGLGNPGEGLIFWLLSMAVYGVAFNFGDTAGAVFIDSRAPDTVRSGAQGILFLMNNGAGYFIGGMGTQVLVNSCADSSGVTDWQMVWLILTGYALAVAGLFLLCFDREA